jgi:hypothetical protein
MKCVDDLVEFSNQSHQDYLPQEYLREEFEDTKEIIRIEEEQTI